MAFNLGSVGDVTGGFGGAGLALQGIGLAGSLFEGMKESKIADQEAGVSQQIAGYEEQITRQRQQQMMLFSQRQQMENFRNVQKARAQGMSAAVNAGAQFGSGIAGAQSEAAAQGGQNQRNLGQDLQIGQNIFGLTDQIDSSKMQLSSLQGSMASAQGMGAIFGGMSGLGQGLLGGSNSLGHLFGNG